MAKKRIEIEIGAKQKVTAVLRSVRAQFRRLASSTRAITTSMARGFTVLSAAVAAFATKSVKSFLTQSKAEAKLEAILRATGYAAGFTAEQLKKQAAELQNLTGRGDQVIISTQGMLASFKQIRGESFKRATMAILDMGAAMDKAGKSESDIESASIRVGRALNDPITGMSALTRVGVAFTDQQKEQIRTLQEAGDVAGAQAVILGELESEFGGTAAAVNAATHGLANLKNVTGDTLEEIGRAIVETDGFDSVIARLTDSMRDLAESGYIELWAENVRSAIKYIQPLVDGIGKAFGGVKRGIQGAAAFAGGFTATSGSIADRFEAGRKMAQEIPEMMRVETELRLKTIQDKRAERARAKEAAQVEEMAAARMNIPTATPMAITKTPESTSMIGIGELFTMMQTGRARQTEVEIMQKQQNTLEEIRDAIKEGGLE